MRMRMKRDPHRRQRGWAVSVESSRLATPFMVRRIKWCMMVLLGVLLLFPAPFGCGEGNAQSNRDVAPEVQSGRANLFAPRLWLDEIFYVIVPGKFFNGDKSNDVMARRYASS